MKLNFKKIIVFIILLSVFTINTKVVSAATLSRGVPKRNENISTIPLTLKIDEGETINSAKFVCETNNTEVICEVKKNEEYSKKFPTMCDSGLCKPVTGDFPVGDNEIVYIELTNNTGKEVDVQVSLKNSDFTIEPFNTTVGKKASSNAKASLIKFSQGTMVPEFNPDVKEYTVYNIQDTINSVTGTYECQDPNTCDSNGWSGGKSVSGNKITLNQGENKVSIELVSENGNNSETYTFTIIRGETSYNSAKLSSISVGDYILTPAFSKDVTEYKVNVPNKITSLANTLKFAAEDSKANITTSSYDNLSVGENVVTITVDNINGDATTEYKITVNRMSLEQIEITNYHDSKVTYQDAEGVKNTLSEEEFKLQYPEEYEKIENGTYKFDEDGKRVTEEDKEEEENKEEEKEEPTKKKNNKTILIVVLIIVGLIIIIVSGIFIFKKKPDNKDKKKKKNQKEETPDEKDENEEIDEDGVEEAIIEKEKLDKDDTVDIDEALSDLMSTKQYNLDDISKDEDN